MKILWLQYKYLWPFINYYIFKNMISYSQVKEIYFITVINVKLNNYFFIRSLIWKFNGIFNWIPIEILKMTLSTHECNEVVTTEQEFWKYEFLRNQFDLKNDNISNVMRNLKLDIYRVFNIPYMISHVFRKTIIRKKSSLQDLEPGNVQFSQVWYVVGYNDKIFFNSSHQMMSKIWYTVIS